MSSLSIPHEFVSVVLLEGPQVKRPRVDLPHIVRQGQDAQIVDQVEQLLVGVVVAPRNDWHPVVELVGEGVSRVVHDHYVLQQSALQNSQVLHQHSPHADAAVPVESVVDQRSCGVEEVQHHVRVALLRGGKDDDFEELVRLSQTLPDVRAHVDTCGSDVPIRKLDVQDHVGAHVGGLKAVDERLVHVQDQGFLVLVARAPAEVDQLGSQDGRVHRGQVLYELHGLEGQEEVLFVPQLALVGGFRTGGLLAGEVDAGSRDCLRGGALPQGGGCFEREVLDDAASGAWRVFGVIKLGCSFACQQEFWLGFEAQLI